MKTTLKKALFSICSTLLLIACGKADKSFSDQDRIVNDAEEAAARAAQDGSNIQGTYKAVFTTLNGQVNGNVPGAVMLRRIDNNLNIYLRFSLGKPSVGHFQNIHVGTRCPTLADDTNGDGYIDINEALAVVGPIIIPLDSDISSQLGQNRFWPKAFPNGSYEYNETGSFTHFWSDLKAPDKKPDDNIAKLAPDQGLSIVGKVVMVQGVNDKPIFNGLDVEGSPLPDSVSGFKSYKNWQVLPVTCGVFMPDDGIKGEEYTEGKSPIPVGPVVDGQDQPAPEGADETPGSGRVIMGPSNSSGSNDAETTTNEGGTSGSESSGSTDGSTVGGASGGTESGSSSTSERGNRNEGGGRTTSGSSDGGDDDWQWPWERLPRIIGGAGSGAE